MNYLGHAWLSFGDEEVVTGNMIGDYVKGLKSLENFTPGIKKGIVLHRKIDAYCDQHPATRRGKLFFREDYGLYSGAIMDTLFDHYLANDPVVFSTAPTLKSFSEGIYAILDSHKEAFPPAFAQFFPHMKHDNWLYQYRSLKGMERALQGLARRAKHMPSPQKAYETFAGHYYQLNQCYFELIDDLSRYVKIELAK